VALAVGGVAFGVAFFAARGLVSGLFGGGSSIPDADWQEFAPPGEKFRVLLPGTSKKEVKTVGTTTLEVHIVDRDRGRVSFSVLFGHLSDADLHNISWEGRFQMSMKGMLGAEPDSKLISEKALTLDGNPGREFVIEVGKKGTALSRIYGIRQGRRNLFLTVGAAGPGFGPETPAVVKFFDSLRLEKESPAALAEELAKAPPGRRLELIAEIGKQGKAAQEVVPVLAEIVKDERDYIAGHAAAELLADLGAAAAPAAPVLTAVLQAHHPRKQGPDNGNTRLKVAGALLLINPKDARAREILRECTRDPNDAVRPWAMYYLLKADPASGGGDLVELVNFWRTKSQDRDNAAMALKKLGPLAAGAIPELVKALGGKDGPLQRSAVSVLDGLGPTAKEAVPALRALDRPGTADDLRDAIREACKKIEGTR
jgi:HEAT repeat protein